MDGLLKKLSHLKMFLMVHIKYKIEDIAIRTNACNIQVSMGIQWLKYTKQQKRIFQCDDDLIIV
ncbi:hypothetical protein ZOSMA_86G00700 [Zostera marina]|uniref:Uncharacterized protein n=1 Tax=Zostera marina TaxID=29655 RepID=A0A0K9NLE4_ZOSMR|nr:hypothetical protein ZOSMA_86G00700 [Zostera marina]